MNIEFQSIYIKRCGGWMGQKHLGQVDTYEKAVNERGNRVNGCDDSLSLDSCYE
jgi:hypothetical protein